MPRTPALLAVLLALALSGCGWPGTPDDAASVPDGAAVSGAPAGEATPPSPGIESGDGGPVAPSASDAAGQEADAPPTESEELTRLLVEVAASQMALERRFDSLAARLEQQRRGANASDPGSLVDAAGSTAVGLALRLFWSVVVLVLIRTLIGALVWFLEALAERYPRTRLLWKRAVPVVRIILWVAAVFFIVRVIFEVDAQGLVAAAAAVGVAVGFAAQDLLKNLFGGLILVFDQPFQVGDKISVGGTYGEVVSIGIRSTRIVTPDDNLVSVPNAEVVDGQVANANAGELNCQVVTDLYLPGVVNEAQAKKIAFEAAASSKYVFLNKPIVVLVKDEFKETFLTRIRVKAYVLDPRYEFLFQSDVTERARAGFRDAGLMNPGMALRAWLDLSHTWLPDAPPADGLSAPAAAPPTGAGTATEAPPEPRQDAGGEASNPSSGAPPTASGGDRHES